MPESARLASKLALEAELARPLAHVLVGYMNTWAHNEGRVPLIVRNAIRNELRSELERHYSRCVLATIGYNLDDEISLGEASLSDMHAADLYLRASERADALIGIVERDLAASLAEQPDEKTIQGLERKDDRPFTVRFATRFQTSAMQAYFRLRAKLRGLVNAETQEPAEGAMLQWVQGKHGTDATVVKMWITMEDERVRASHVDAGHQYGIAGPIAADQPFELAGGRLMFPGDRSLGASLSEIINCFPAGTMVSGNATAATRHWFDGEVVEIVTRAGHKLAGTPNHPILTPNGWVAIGSLDVGSNVFCGVDGRHEELSAAKTRDIDNDQTAIEKVFDALAVGSMVVRKGRLAVNFHGDAPAHDVDVVTADRVLRNGRHTKLLQHLAQQGLASADLGECLGLAQSLALDLGFARDRSASGDIGRARDVSPFVIGGTSESQNVGCGAVAQGAASPLDSGGDSSAGYLERLREREHRLPHAVALSRIVSLSRREFRGHVFNLSTVEGFYLANGIVASNCRCHLEYFAATEHGYVPLSLSTPSIPAVRPWRRGDRFGVEIPIKATSVVTLNGRTRARVVLGDDKTIATLAQTSPTVINVRIDGETVARAVHANGVVSSITVAKRLAPLGIERLIRESVAHSWQRRPQQ